MDKNSDLFHNHYPGTVKEQKSALSYGSRQTPSHFSLPVYHEPWMSDMHATRTQRLESTNAPCIRLWAPRQ